MRLNYCGGEKFFQNYLQISAVLTPKLAQKPGPAQSRRNTTAPAQPVNSASVAVASP